MTIIRPTTPKVLLLFFWLTTVVYGCKDNNKNENSVAYFHSDKDSISLHVPTDLENYYDQVDFKLSGTKLYEELAATTIAKHINIQSYSARHKQLYDIDAKLEHRDSVVLMYSGESRYREEFTSGRNNYKPQTFNTEHVYPQSLIVNTAKGDLHHLRVCDSRVNTRRSNHPFTDGKGSYTLKNKSWYPGDRWKGDVARMIMYLNLRYAESFEDVGSLELFLKWNAEDPVSGFEIQRNNRIAQVQGNRNPFIDNPYLATIIWGGISADNLWK